MTTCFIQTEGALSPGFNNSNATLVNLRWLIRELHLNYWSLGGKAPPGWKKASGHLIYDVKMDFTQKIRWVKDGHRTPNPNTWCYAGVVSCESIWITMTYSVLHKIDVKAADIQNAYLQAPSSEKKFIYCCEEFRLEHVGSVALIRRSL